MDEIFAIINNLIIVINKCIDSLCPVILNYKNEMWYDYKIAWIYQKRDFCLENTKKMLQMELKIMRIVEVGEMVWIIVLLY